MNPEQASEIILRSRDNSLRTDLSFRVLYEKNFNAVSQHWTYQTTVVVYSRAGVRLNHWLSGDQGNMSDAISRMVKFFTSPKAVPFWNKGP